MTQPLPNVQPSPRAPKAALILLAQTLSGVQAFWRTDPGPSNPGLAPGLERASLWLRASAYQSVGTDELRAAFDSVANENVFVLVGQRRLTLSVRAESLDANLEAYDLLERVRFRLRTQVARAIFSPAKLSLRDVQPISILAEQWVKQGGIRVAQKVATMDIRWNLVVYQDPADPDQGQWIKSVNGNNVIPGNLPTPPV